MICNKVSKDPYITTVGHLFIFFRERSPGGALFPFGNNGHFKCYVPIWEHDTFS